MDMMEEHSTGDGEATGDGEMQNGQDADSDEETLGRGFDIDAGKRDLIRGRADSIIPPPPMPHGEARIDRRAPVGARMRVAASPVRPSKEEMARHYVSHIPYAAWCECCVRARALDNKHLTPKVTKSK